MMTLKYNGFNRGSLKEGMYVNVPTNWATGLSGMVTKDAIPEIMEALEEKWITFDDYDTVFETLNDKDYGRLLGYGCRPGHRAGRMLRWWRKV